MKTIATNHMTMKLEQTRTGIIVLNFNMESIVLNIFSN